MDRPLFGIAMTVGHRLLVRDFQQSLRSTVWVNCPWPLLVEADCEGFQAALDEDSRAVLDGHRRPEGSGLPFYNPLPIP